MILLSRKQSKNQKLSDNVEYPEYKEKWNVVRNMNRQIFLNHIKQDEKRKSKNFDITDNSDDIVSKNIVTFINILFNLFRRILYCTSKDNQLIQEYGVVINNSYSTTK